MFITNRGRYYITGDIGNAAHTHTHSSWISTLNEMLNLGVRNEDYR